MHTFKLIKGTPVVPLPCSASQAAPLPHHKSNAPPNLNQCPKQRNPSSAPHPDQGFT